MLLGALFDAGCASAHRRESALKYIRAITAMAQAPPVSRPKVRETPCIRRAHARPVATDRSGSTRKVPGRINSQISSGLITTLLLCLSYHDNVYTIGKEERETVRAFHEVTA